jgi:hypothetical protein
MSVIQSGGVYYAAQLHPAGLITAYLISWQWIGNSRAAVDIRPRFSRVAYGLGGAVGYLTTMLAVGLWHWLSR